ncbi:MAG: type II toxin-antitoxin system HicA family toxin [Planctomycetota bacterium]
MPELPKVSGRKTVKAVERLGFRQAPQRGSHVVMVRDTPQGKVGCAVPLHRELTLGTLRGILRQAKLGLDEFVKAL